MNAMLVNVILFNVWSVALTHFLTLAFNAYLNYTDAGSIFGIQAQNMRFFKYFFNYYIFLAPLFAFSFVAAVYLICKPRDELKVKEILQKEDKEKEKIADDLKKFAN